MTRGGGGAHLKSNSTLDNFLGPKFVAEESKKLIILLIILAFGDSRFTQIPQLLPPFFSQPENVCSINN